MAAYAPIPREHSDLFTVGPLRFLGRDSIVKSHGAGASKTSHVLVTDDGEHSPFPRRLRATEPALAQLATKLAEDSRGRVLAGELVGVSGDGRAVYRTIGVALADIEKARIDPLSPAAVDSWINELATRLGAISGDEASDQIEMAMDSLDFDWDTRAGEQMLRARVATTAVLATPSRALIYGQRMAIGRALSQVLRRTTGAAQRLPAMRGGVGSTFALRNPAVAAAMARHHGFFVRDQYGRMAPQLAQRAMDIIIRGQQDGLSRNRIGEMLRLQLQDGLRQTNYWTNVAANAVTRARSYALGSSMRAAGFTHYQIYAIIDERTTDCCLMLHGQILPIGGAMQQAEWAMRDPNPEGVLWHQPFIVERDNEFRVEYPDGTHRVVGEIHERRNAENPGRYSFGGSQVAADASIGFPPYHYYCRTTLVPVSAGEIGQV